MLPIILTNNFVDKGLYDEPPTELLGVFIGSTTTHLCRWNDNDIPHILRHQDEWGVPLRHGPRRCRRRRLCRCLTLTTRKST